MNLADAIERKNTATGRNAGGSGFRTAAAVRRSVRGIGGSAGNHPEALVVVGCHLVDEVDLPGEVLAHRFLAPLAALARRKHDVVRLAGHVRRAVSSGRPAAAHASVPPASAMTGTPAVVGQIGGRQAGPARRPARSARSPRPSAARSRSAGEAAADREPGAGNVALGVAPAGVEIDDDDACRRASRSRKAAGSMRRRRAPSSPSTRGACGPLAQSPSTRPGGQHRHVVPAHLLQPRGGHRRPDAVVVDQHDARVPGGDMGVGLLHELPARRRARPGEMPGLGIPRACGRRARRGCGVRLRRARPRASPCRCGGCRSVRRPAPPPRSPPGRPASETSGGRRVAPCTTSNPARCQAIVPSFSDMILLRKPALRSACAPMMLRVRPPQLTITVGVGRRHHVGEAVDQLGAGHADRGRDAVVVVLLVGAAVEDRDIGAAVDQRLQVGRGNPRRAGLVLDDLGERLARHVHAAVEAIPGRLPGGDAAVEHRDIGVAERRSCGRAARSAEPSPSSHHTTRVPRRGTRSSTSNSSRLSGTHDASSR